MVQGRGLMVVAYLVFGALYHDITVRIFIASVVVAWCLYLIGCTLYYGYYEQRVFGHGALPRCAYFANSQAIVLCIMLAIFAVLHSVGIALTVIYA